jgi:hypothetical protein
VFFTRVVNLREMDFNFRTIKFLYAPAGQPVCRKYFFVSDICPSGATYLFYDRDYRLPRWGKYPI